MLERFRNLVGASLTSLIIASASNSDPLADAVIMDFEDKSVMSENVENLRTVLPDMLQNKLEGFFDVVEIKQSDDSNPNNLSTIRQNYPGLDYMITGSYSVVNNRNLTINSRIANLETGKLDIQSAEGPVDDLFDLVDNLVDEIKTDVGHTETVSNIDNTGSAVDTVETTESESAATKDSSMGNAIDPIAPSRDQTAEESRWSMGPYFELSFPMGPESFKESYKNSFSYGILWNNYSSGGLALIGPIIGHKLFGLDWDKITREVEDFDVMEGGSLSFFNILGGLGYCFNTDNNIMPSVSVGGGYYWAKVDGLSITVNVRKTALSYEDTDNGPGIFIRSELELLASEGISLSLIGTYEHAFIGDGFDFVSTGIGVNYGGRR